MRSNLIFLILFVFFFSSCEEIMDIPFEGGSKNELAVEGIITTDTSIYQVVLSRTDDYFNIGPQIMETGATVTLSDGTTFFNLNELSPGVYSTDSNFYGIIGKTYTLNIELSDTAEYSASETITPLPQIDSITIKYGGGYSPNSPKIVNGYNVNYFGPEPAEKGQFYLWKLYLNDSLYTDTYAEMVFTNDEFVNGNYINDILLFFIPEEDIHYDTVNAKIAMYSISKEFYNFLIGFMLETTWRGTPWDGPSANTKGNINNGAWGYFRASDVKYASKMLIRNKVPGLSTGLSL